MDKYPKQISGRVLTLNLRLPTVLGGMAVLFCGFVFVFILGLLLGSGYDLEERLPVLEKVLPQKAATVPPVVIAKNEEGKVVTTEGGKSGAESPKGEQQKSDAAKAEADDWGKSSGRGIIEQGDLAYRDRLKSDKPASSRSKTAAQAQKDDKQKEAQKKEERFRYVFQAASYKAQDYADRFTAKLKGQGIKARTLKSVEKNSTWYRVMIDFTGTPSQVGELQKTMRANGVSSMVQTSKKPAR